MPGSAPGAPEQSDNPPFDAAVADSQGHGYWRATAQELSSASVPSIREPYQVEEYAKIFDTPVMDRLVRVNAPSSMGDTTGSEFDIPTGYLGGKSMPSPLNTSISSYDVPLFSPQTDQDHFANAFRNPGPQGLFLRPPERPRSNSYATSDIWSDNDDDGSCGNTFPRGNGDQLNAENNHGMAHRQALGHSEPGQWPDLDSGLASSGGSWVDGPPYGGNSNETSLTGLVQYPVLGSNTLPPTPTSCDVGGDFPPSPIGVESSSDTYRCALGGEEMEPSCLDTPQTRSVGPRGRHHRQLQSLAPPRRRDRRQSDPSRPGLGSCGRGVSMHRSISQNPRVATVPISGTNDMALGTGNDPILQPKQLPRRPTRGKRNGPMTEQQKKKTRQKRENKSTCITCKTSKVSVSNLRLP